MDALEKLDWGLPIVSVDQEYLRQGNLWLPDVAVIKPVVHQPKPLLGAWLFDC